MKMRFLLLTAVLALAASQVAAQRGAATGPSPQTTAAETRAERAIAELQTTLGARLKSELGRGGPAAAVTVCRDEAQQLTQSIGTAHGLAIGRTSDRVRNPANAPRPWMLAYVASYAGRPAAEAQPATFELEGNRLGVLRPIATAELCVVCHGPREAVQASIGDVLAVSYPDDRAVGFGVGDLRGWFWAEVDLR